MNFRLIALLVSTNILWISALILTLSGSSLSRIIKLSLGTILLVAVAMYSLAIVLSLLIVVYLSGTKSGH